jgi:hypothetical protein
MRKLIVGLASLLLVAACSKASKETKADEAAPAPAANATAAAPASAAAPAATATAAPDVSGPAISGTYTANGKPATLTSISAHPDEPFSGQPVTMIVMTSQDHSANPKPDFDAAFGHLGDAIVLKVHPDGSIIGTEIVHSGLKRQGAISWIGELKLEDYRVGGGQISGHLTSNGPRDVFDEPVNVDLKFHTPAPRG